MGAMMLPTCEISFGINKLRLRAFANNSTVREDCRKDVISSSRNISNSKISIKKYE